MNTLATNLVGRRVRLSSYATPAVTCEIVYVYVDRGTVMLGLVNQMNATCAELVGVTKEAA